MITAQVMALPGLLLLTIQALGTATLDTSMDPRGPVEYPGMKPTVDEQGVQVKGYDFRNECLKPSPWQASWIWLDAERSPVVAMFRKEVTLAETPARVAAWLTADMKYRLYVNGRLVSRGPVDMGRDYAGGDTHRWFYDFRDLTPFFQKGTNVIAAEVFRQWPIGFTVSRGSPGLLFEADVTLPGQEKVTIKSDATWRAMPAAQFPDPTIYDAGKEPSGWRSTGFDDAVWPTCREVKDVWQPLVPSEIPSLMEARYPVQRLEGLPSKVISRDGSFKVVFDRVLSAYPTVKVKGGNGAQMTIRAQHSATVILGGGEQCFEFPFMTEIAPAFTVEVKNLTSPLEILDAGANFTSQPVEYRGTFECSDPKLNRIWKVSRWAVQVCLQTHHLDSPNHQEPISDPGDYVIESMVNYYAFAQPWLARQDVRKFAWLLADEHYRNFHTSYSIAWLQMLMDYYDYTGDPSLVQEMTPYVQELLDTFTSWRGTNGLISEAPNYMFMDWVDIGGFGCHHPPAVIGQGYLTAFYYHGLEMAARAAAMAGDSARVEKYGRLRTELVAAFNRELWVSEKGLYRDGKPFQSSVKPSQWLPADKDIETFSPHVNLLAALCDLAPRERQAAIIERVLALQPLNTQPWFMHWVFSAIDHAGLFDKFGMGQMRRWQVVPETQSFREMWNEGDLSHGWCSTPLVQMSSRVLGVTPAAPGYKRANIRPTLCDLAWARGSVPTPHGDVTVSWALGEERLTLGVTIPAEMDAEVTVPTSRFEQPVITLDGRKVEPVVHVPSGTYCFEVTGKRVGQLTPAVEPIPAFAPGARILFQGDSITDGNRGRSADPNHILGHGYVFLIAARHGAAFPEEKLDFINRGVSGNTVLDLEQRWQPDTLDLKPDLLSILIGVNDHGKGVPLEQFEQVYDQLLTAAKVATPKLKLVLGEPFVKPGGILDEDIRRRQEIVARLARKHGAALVHFQRVFDEATKRAPADYWIWDSVHPTYRGHQLMADEWERAVRDFWK
jgi:lysophospholipase L1-like esterase